MFFTAMDREMRWWKAGSKLYDYWDTSLRHVRFEGCILLSALFSCSLQPTATSVFQISSFVGPETRYPGQIYHTP